MAERKAVQRKSKEWPVSVIETVSFLVIAWYFEIRTSDSLTGTLVSVQVSNVSSHITSPFGGDKVLEEGQKRCEKGGSYV